MHYRELRAFGRFFSFEIAEYLIVPALWPVPNRPTNATVAEKLRTTNVVDLLRRPFDANRCTPLDHNHRDTNVFSFDKSDTFQ